MLATRVIIFCLITTVFQLGMTKRNFKIIFQREEISYVNSKFVIVNDHSIKRLNRTSPYVYNFNITLLQPWYNNVSYSLKTYEKRSNEYRESFISLGSRICDGIENANFLFKIAMSHGNMPKKCPMEKFWYIKDAFLDENTFPEGFPISKWKFSFHIFTTANKTKLIQFEIYLETVAKKP